jgi:hypothetical protein
MITSCGKEMSGFAPPLRETYLGDNDELGISETWSLGRTETLTTGQPRPLLRFHVATSFSCPTIAVGLSCPGAAPEDRARKAIAGDGNAVPTRPRDRREGSDILVPPIPGTELGTARLCSIKRRPMTQRRKEREPSAGSNNKMSWKSVRRRR